MKTDTTLSKALPLIIIGIIGILYVMFRPAFLIEAEDARGYGLAVMGQVENWQPNPHHLVFEYFHLAFYKTASFFGYSGGVYPFMQLVTALFSVGCLMVIYDITKRLNFQPFYAIMTLLCTAFAYGYWTYSVEADTYLPPIFFVLLCIPIFLSSLEKESRYRHMIGLALCVSAATLVTQQYVLLLPIIAISVFIAWIVIDKFDGFFKRLGEGLVFAGLSTALIGGTYLGISFLQLGHENLEESMTWIRGMTNDGLWTEFSWVKSPVLAVVGLGRSIWGVNYLFAQPGFLEAVTPLFTGSSLVEEYYAAQRTIGPLKFMALLAATVAGSIALIFLVVRLIVGLIKKTYLETNAPEKTHNGFLIFSAVYLPIFYLFVFLWEPDNIEFILHLVPVFWILVFLFLQRLPGQKAIKAAALIFAVCQFGVNFSGSLKPYADIENDYWTWSNASIAAEVKAGDVFLVECGSHCARQIKLSHPATIIEIDYHDPDSLSKIAEELKAVKTGRVFISDWLFNPENGHPFAQDLDKMSDQIDSFYKLVGKDLTKVETDQVSSNSNLKVHEFWEYTPRQLSTRRMP